MWGDKDEKKKKDTIFEEDHYTFLGRGVNFKGPIAMERYELMVTSKVSSPQRTP